MESAEFSKEMSEDKICKLTAVINFSKNFLKEVLLKRFHQIIRVKYISVEKNIFIHSGTVLKTILTNGNNLDGRRDINKVSNVFLNRIIYEQTDDLSLYSKKDMEESYSLSLIISNPRIEFKYFYYLDNDDVLNDIVQGIDDVPNSAGIKWANNLYQIDDINIAPEQTKTFFENLLKERDLRRRIKNTSKIQMFKRASLKSEIERIESYNATLIRDFRIHNASFKTNELNAKNEVLRKFTELVGKIETISDLVKMAECLKEPRLLLKGKEIINNSDKNIPHISVEHIIQQLVKFELELEMVENTKKNEDWYMYKAYFEYSRKEEVINYETIKDLLNSLLAIENIIANKNISNTELQNKISEYYSFISQEVKNSPSFMLKDIINIKQQLEQIDLLKQISNKQNNIEYEMEKLKRLGEVTAMGASIGAAASSITAVKTISDWLKEK